MVFNKRAPDWKCVGTEPPEELKSEGFKAGYKPPAAYFNWFFNRIGEAVTEIQGALKALAFKDRVGDADIIEISGGKITQDDEHRLVSDINITNWNGKVSADGGDISETAVSSLENVTTEFPVPEAGESVRTFLGKVRKVLADWNNFKTGIITLGKLANNCTTTGSGMALDARQGKILLDLVNTHKSSGDHDGRYYTEGEINNFLAGKAASGHTHDDRYFTEAEINNKIVNNGATTAGGYMLDARYGKTLYDLYAKLSNQMSAVSVVDVTGIYADVTFFKILNIVHMICVAQPKRAIPRNGEWLNCTIPAGYLPAASLFDSNAFPDGGILCTALRDGKMYVSANYEVVSPLWYHAKFTYFTR